MHTCSTFSFPPSFPCSLSANIFLVLLVTMMDTQHSVPIVFPTLWAQPHFLTIIHVDKGNLLLIGCWWSGLRSLWRIADHPSLNTISDHYIAPKQLWSIIHSPSTRTGMVPRITVKLYTRPVGYSIHLSPSQPFLKKWAGNNNLIQASLFLLYN
jgi:hypothetical protein